LINNEKEIRLDEDEINKIDQGLMKEDVKSDTKFNKFEAKRQTMKPTFNQYQAGY